MHCLGLWHICSLCSHGRGLIMFCLVRTGALFLCLSSAESLLPGSLTHGLVHHFLDWVGRYTVFILHCLGSCRHWLKYYGFLLGCIFHLNDAHDVNEAPCV